MKPTKVAAWRCGACSKTYAYTRHGKRFAEHCCLCTECMLRPSAYTGLGTKCKQCHEAVVRESVTAEYERALKAYETTFGAKPAGAS